MNLTDVDDRIIANAAAAGVGIRDYTAKFVQAFFDDCKALSIEAPEHWIRATDHIDEMVRLIQRLQEKSFTYPGDGSIYYRIAKFPQYGRLSKIDLTGIQAGARVDNDRYEKESARDFALWKAPKPGEHFWETPIGRGRPGWHIECSAMAMKYLGETLDIHTGGIDLAFPHHENEIAQSEGATGKPFVRYWLHAEHLLVEGEKMSKSAGNFFTLRDLFAKGYEPSALRFVLAGVPYRKQLNFTFDGLQQAASSVERLRNFADRLRRAKFPNGKRDGMAARIVKAAEEFDAGLSDDLNTARARANSGRVTFRRSWSFSPHSTESSPSWKTMTAKSFVRSDTAARRADRRMQKSTGLSRSATPQRKGGISPPPTASAKNSRIVVYLLRTPKMAASAGNASEP